MDRRIGLNWIVRAVPMHTTMHGYLFEILMVTCLFLSILCLCMFSTLRPGQRAVASLWCRRAPVWRTSGPRRSSSAMAPGAPATSSPTSTASGWPPWSTTTSSSAALHRTLSRANRCAHASADAKCAPRICSNAAWRNDWGKKRREKSYPEEKKGWPWRARTYWKQNLLTDNNIPICPGM